MRKPERFLSVIMVFIMVLTLFGAVLTCLTVYPSAISVVNESDSDAEPAEPSKEADLHKHTVDAVSDKAVLYTKDNKDKRVRTKEYREALVFWDALMGRTADVSEKDSSAGNAAVDVSVTGMLPEDIKARVTYIVFDEESIYSETAVASLGLELTDAEGNAYIPEEPVTVTLSGPAIKAASGDDSSVIVYSYAENVDRKESISKKTGKDMYAADVLVYRSSDADDSRRAYEVYDKNKKYKDGEDAVRYTEDKDGLSLSKSNNTVKFDYQFGEKTPASFIIAEQITERSVSDSEGTTSVEVRGALDKDSSFKVKDAEKTVDDASLKGDTVVAVDLAVSDKDAGEYQPDKPVQVTITDPDIKKTSAKDKKDNKELKLYRISENGNPEEIKDAEFDGDSVTFETESLDTFAVMSSTVEGYIKSADGKTWKVSATYDAESGIPDKGVKLYVKKIKEAKDSVTLDIKLVDEKDESRIYQPKEGSSVALKVTLLDDNAETKATTAQVQHIREDGTEETLTAELSTNKEGYVFDFDAESFSTFELRYSTSNKFVFYFSRLRIGGTEHQISGTQKIPYNKFYEWMSLSSIRDMCSDLSGYNEPAYSILYAHDRAYPYDDACAVAFSEGWIGIVPSHVTLIRRPDADGTIKHSTNTFDVNVVLNDNSLPITVKIKDKADKSFTYVNTTHAGDSTPFTAHDLIEANKGKITDVDIDKYAVVSSTINNESVSTVNNKKIKDSDLTNNHVVLAGKPAFQYDGGTYLMLYEYNSTDVQYPAAYKWSYMRGSTEVNTRDYPYIISLEPAIARVSNDGGSSWVNFSQLIDPNGNGYGAFDYANTLTGDVIIETLYNSHDRYTLSRGFDFTTNANITIRTTTDTTTWDPSGNSTIKRGGPATFGSLIKHSGTGSLTLSNITLDGDNKAANENGGLISVTGGTLKLNSGATLQNASVQNNRNGGAVYVATGAAMEMSGGSITGCSATNGSAVFVGGSGRFTMSGGSISGNTLTQENGGAVQVDSNTAKLNFSGAPVIYNNQNNGTKQSNVYLQFNKTGSSDSIINVTGSMAAGAKIGIWPTLADNQDSSDPFGYTAVNGANGLLAAFVNDYYSDHVADNDRQYLVGWPKTAGSADKIIWKKVICKITDNTGTMLYVDSGGGNYLPAIYGTIREAFNDINAGNLRHKDSDTPYTGACQVKMLADYEVPDDDVVNVDAGKTMTFTTAEVFDPAHPEAGDGYTFLRTGEYDGAGKEDFTPEQLAASVGKAVLRRDEGSTSAFFTVSSDTASAVTTFTMSDLIIDGQGVSLTAPGGCLTAYKTNTTIKDCLICRFTADAGGAVYTSGSSLNVEGSVFDTCQSGKHDSGLGGGAIHTFAVAVTISGSTFQNCSAIWQGGAVYQYRQKNTSTTNTMSLSDCDFIDCNARAGGGVEADVHQVTAENCNFIRCNAQDVKYKDDEGKEVTVKGTNGGGLNNYTNDIGLLGNLSLKNCSFEGCTGVASGGGLFSQSLTISLDNCSFKDAAGVHCTAANGGGAAFTNNKATKTAVVKGNSVFENCIASGNGGGIFSNGGSLKVESTTVGGSDKGCTAGKGGGIYTEGNITLLSNVTVKGNKLSGNDKLNAAGIHIINGKKLILGDASTATITDTDISGNTTSGGTDSNIRLSVITAEGPSKGYNNNDSVVVNSNLGNGCLFKIANPVDLFWQFGTSGGEKSGVAANNYNSSKFQGDGSSLYGTYESGSVTKIIWQGDYICRITNGNGLLLALGGRPAVYATLAGAFNDFKKTGFTLYGGGEEEQTPVNIEMLILSHEISARVETTGTTIILKTGPKPDDDPNTSYKFRGTYGRCRLYGVENATYSLITLGNDAELTATDITFGGATTGNKMKSKRDYGAVFRLQGNNPKLVLDNGAAIRYVESTGNAAAVCINKTDAGGNGTVTLNNGSEITGCTAQNGGAIYANNTLTGAAVAVNGGSSIVDCTSKGNGGAIYLNKGELTLSGTGSITNCSANADGGAVNVNDTDSNLTVSGITIEWNKRGNSANNGGAFNISKGSVTINDGVTISGCAAKTTGGAFLITNSGTVTMNAGTISGNHCGGVGGGAFRLQEGGNLIVNEGTISGNYIDRNDDAYGGAINIKKGSATIKGGTISGNHVRCTLNNKTVMGGAIHVGGENKDEGTLTITGGTITENFAEGTQTNTIVGGGAISLRGTKAVATISGCTISGNTANNTVNVANSKGAGICVNRNSTLNIQGSLDFGSSSVDQNGNLLTSSLTEAKNGGDDYIHARQDIYVTDVDSKAANVDKPAGNLVVSGKISGNQGSIWVWMEKGTQIHENEQFATIAEGVRSDPGDMTVFRDARTNADTNAGGSYLTGAQHSTDKEKVIWTPSVLGGRRVILRKVASGSYTPLQGAKFELEGNAAWPGLTDDDGDPVYQATSDESGVFFVGRFGYGTYCYQEVTAPSSPTGYGSNKDKWFCMIVQKSGVYVSTHGFADKNAAIANAESQVPH